MDTSVDVRLVEYLLRASRAALKTFSMSIFKDKPSADEPENYFGESLACMSP